MTKLAGSLCNAGQLKILKWTKCAEVDKKGGIIRVSNNYVISQQNKRQWPLLAQWGVKFAIMRFCYYKDFTKR